MEFSSDGCILAASGMHEEFYLRDVKTKKPLAGFAGHAIPVCALKFSANAQLLASGCNSGFVQLWNVATLALHSALYTRHPSLVRAVGGSAFSPDEPFGFFPRVQRGPFLGCTSAATASDSRRGVKAQALVLRGRRAISYNKARPIECRLRKRQGRDM
jgi:WD40 repeat protein